MKAATIHEIKQELTTLKPVVLAELCLRLGKFKKENKELLAFLLFESDNIPVYVENVKQEIEQQFMEINKSNIYFIKKSVRKILRSTNRYIRFSLSKQIEAELLIHFCNCLINFSIPLKKSRQLMNLYENQLKKIDAALSTLHPDLQYDFKKQLLT